MFSARASFVSGHYTINPDLSPREASIAALHEEAHGIIRRSTLYGLLLHRIVPPGRETLSAVDGLAHKLFSLARTSEEVHATFSSLASAIWAGDIDASRRELAGAPEYQYYFDIGAKLTETFENLHVRTLVLEGIVRFCWSSRTLEALFGGAPTRERLAELPACAYPDRRLAVLRKQWPAILAEGLADKILERPEIAVFLGKSFSALHDPLHAIRGEIGDAVVMDPDGAIRGQFQKQALMAARLSEAATGFVADCLAEHYEGTDLSAATVRESFALIERARKLPCEAPNRMGLIERVSNLAERRHIRLCDALEWRPAEQGRITGMRAPASFERNFGLPAEAQWDRTVPFVIYATAQDPGSGASPGAEGSVGLDIALCPPGPEEPAERLRRWLPAPGIVSLWSSLLIDAPALWAAQLPKFRASNHLPWVVVDRDPYAVLMKVRPLIEEVHGFLHQPVAKRPALGGLAVSTMVADEAHSSGLRGLVFMGTVHTLQMIAMMLKKELGSDFRGMGGPIFHDQSRLKRNEGRALVNWLSANEHVFDFGGQNGT